MIIEIREIGKGEKEGIQQQDERCLFHPFGGVVKDTPGMRELGVESGDFSKTFADIEELTLECRFKDCTHTNEPGCAVQKALIEGLIDQRRLDSYYKLKNESSYEGLNSKEIERKKAERLFKDVGGMKNIRKFAKEKNNKNL
jgi:ribosome biogenesis GTPase